ncbi:MAG: ATP-binding protein [Gammaproteobacteria bacterium]|nr:ATP-binding protein [Gammaproteobacteria bacterium]
MNEFNSSVLRQFIDEGEKRAPPVFVGRDDILDDILSISKRSWKPGAWFREGNHGIAGNTRIVHGAPGAGKSSVLRKLRDWEMTPSVALGLSRIKPRVLLLNSALIARPLDILKPLASLICKRKAPDFVERYERSLSLGVNLGNAGITMQRQTRSYQNPSLTGIVDFQHWIDFLPKLSRLKSPVIIAIDEAQRFNHDASSPVAQVLQALHDNAWNLPLTLVLAGLGDTLDKSRKMQLTGGTKLHEVGCLSFKQKQQVMQGFCQTFGINAEGFENRLVTYAEPSEDWPRHLHFAQAILGQELLKNHGDIRALDWILLDEEFRKSRIRYYQSQQSNPMRSLLSLMATVMEQFKTDMKLEDIKELIEGNVKSQAGFDLENSLLEGRRDAYELIRHLVHQGALQEAESGIFYSPIPSFRSFLIEQGNVDSKVENTVSGNSSSNL